MRAGLLALVAVALVAVAGFAGQTMLRGGSGLPAFSHVYVIVMENQTTERMLTSPAAPFIQKLASRYALATRYRAIAHPSQPNYIALFSGSTNGVIGDTPVSLSGRNLADQLEEHGKTWRVFAENVPSGCFQGDQASGGIDGPGTYVRRHEPAIEFKDISGNAARCANITGLSQFDPAAADYELIVPNTCHDMHDCGIHEGNDFLRSIVTRIVDSPAWQHGGVLFLTFDESTDFGGSGGGTVPLLVVSPDVAPGSRSAADFSHYSLVRTIQDAWGLGCAGETCSAQNLEQMFRH